MRTIIGRPPDRAACRRARRTTFRSPGHSSGCAADFRFHRLGLRVYEFARWPEDDATSSPGRADRRCSGDPAPVIDAAARQAVLDQVRAAPTGAGPVRPDVAVVLALAGPCRLLERVAPDRSTRREAKRRIARASAEAPFAPGVATIVDELIAAMTATATAIAAA